MCILLITLSVTVTLASNRLTNSLFTRLFLLKFNTPSAPPIDSNEINSLRSPVSVVCSVFPWLSVTSTGDFVVYFRSATNWRFLLPRQKVLGKFTSVMPHVFHLLAEYNLIIIETSETSFLKFPALKSSIRIILKVLTASSWLYAPLSISDHYFILVACGNVSSNCILKNYHDTYFVVSSELLIALCKTQDLQRYSLFLISWSSLTLL